MLQERMLKSVVTNTSSPEASIGALGLIVWTLDPETLRCCAINAYMPMVLGYTFDAWLVEQPHWIDRLVAVDDRERCRALLVSARSTAQVQHDDLRFVAADGRIVWMHVLVRLQADHTLCGVLIDISEHKQTEEALRTELTRLHLIGGYVTDVFALYTPDGRYSFVSSSCEELLGYTADELIGSPVEALIHPDDLAEYRHAYATVLADTSAGTLVYRVRTRDGRWRWLETSARAMREAEHGGVVEVYASSRDITQRKQDEDDRAQSLLREQQARAEAEVLRQTDRMKSEFIADISHELRTPLHHIKGYATTLLRPYLHFDEQTTREYLRIITEESDKLERLIVDLLDTSRIETGALRLEFESVQLDDLLNKAVRNWQGVGDHRFALVLPPAVPPIAADPYRLQQVLDNLLSNVVRYTPPGTHTTLQLDVRRDELVVSVCDSGPGIDAAHLPHVFDRFYQAEHPRRRRGNGLGLFICKGIIEQHGGRIWAEVMPDSGTVVRFSLPRRRMSAKGRS
jgi:PAS domain S-box-containing protein